MQHVRVSLGLQICDIDALLSSAVPGYQCSPRMDYDLRGLPSLPALAERFDNQFEEKYMRIKLIATAIAGLTALPAMAQSNVTIYGVADAYFKSTSGDGKRITGIDAGGENGSRLGFKGSENLGNGLKAIFDFQFGSLALDGNTGINSTRYAYVGLESNKLGSVILGRLQSPGYYSSYYFAPGEAHFFSAYQFLTKGIAKRGVGASINTGWNAASRRNNAVAYMAPEMGGLKTTLMYGFGEQDGESAGQANREGFAALGLDYTNGLFKASYTYQGITNSGGATTDQREHFLGASYDFGMVKLLGSAQTAKVSGGGFSTETDKLYSIGAQFKLGAHAKLSVGYVKANVDAANGDGKGYTLGLEYMLSKRTHLYAGYGRVVNDNGTKQFNFREGLAIANGESVNTVGAGISHFF